MRNGLLGGVAIWLASSAQLVAQPLTPAELPVLIEPVNGKSAAITLPATNAQAGSLPGMGVSLGEAPPEFTIVCGDDCAATDYIPTGGCHLEFMTGFYNGIGGGVPRYNFVPIGLRVGKVLECGRSEGLLRGNFEAIFEITGAPVTKGPSTFYTGFSLLSRYNFVQPEWRLIPYVQLGAGATYNDGFRDPNQRAMGSSCEFLLHAQVGARYFINDQLTFNVEAGFIHISNAGLSERNRGINALGGSIGFTYFLGGPRTCNPCW